MPAYPFNWLQVVVDRVCDDVPLAIHAILGDEVWQ